MRRSLSTRLSVLLLGALFAQGPLAWAQPSKGAVTSPAEAPADPVLADKDYLRGKELHAKRQYKEARASYLAALKHHPRDYRVLGNLGFIEVELGMMRDAAEHLFRCKLNFPSDVDNKLKPLHDEVDRLFEKARMEVGALELSLHFQGESARSIDEAEVLIDGKTAGRTPLPSKVFVEPGSHIVAVRLRGHPEVSKTVQAVKGQSIPVSLSLERNPARVRFDVVDETGNAVKGAEVTVAGRRFAPRELAEGVFLAAGDNRVVVTHSEYETLTRILPLSNGANVHILLELKKPPVSATALTVAGVSVAVVGIGFGIGSITHSGVRDSDADAAWVTLDNTGGDSACSGGKNKALCDELKDADAGFRTFRGLAIGGFIVGGAAAVATVIYVVTGLPKSSPKPEGDVQVQATFSPAPGGGAAVLWGTF